MPTVTSLSLNDGTATPVIRLFAGRAIGPAFSKFEYVKYPDLRAGNPTIEVTWSDSSAARKTVKQSVKVTVPMVRLINGVNTVIGACLYSNGSFTLPDDATAQEAADIASFVANLLGNPFIQAGIKSREPLN